MISKEETQKIKKVLGSKYSPVIIDRLNKRKITNAKSNPYSPESIQKIVTGKIENSRVELEIAKLVYETVEAKKKTEKEKKRLLK
ncbi:hypothetical protein [Flavobacterium cerinum]|uniref:Uncharacterized protein n=1 Tax=Flavobacterium cerinum TaxID=2502784 RepID=A0ABY5IUW0_9FLAO|nr:hypothetical protein [Flavobacterium cerinum]UUC45558.1 hypothetical protein NOX80_18300 [Flavobacterium cerinum]